MSDVSGNVGDVENAWERVMSVRTLETLRIPVRRCGHLECSMTYGAYRT